MEKDEIERRKIVSSNIRKLIKEKGITQKELAKAIGKSQNSITEYMSLRSFPPAGVIQKIADYFGVKKSDIDTTWKTGNEIISSSANNMLPEYVDLNRVFYSGLEIRFAGYTLTEKQVRQLRRVLYGVFSEEIDIKPSEDWDKNIVNEIKVVDSIEEPKADYDIRDYRNEIATGLVSAGDGICQDDYINIEVRLPVEEVPEPGEYNSIAKVIGHSMEPIINDGDLLFVRAQSQVDYNQIGIFQVNGENFVKKLRHDNKNKPYLESLNSDYDDVFIDEDDEIRVIGEVVGTYSN